MCRELRAHLAAVTWFLITFLLILTFWPVKYIYLTQPLTTFSSFAYSPRFSIFKKALGSFLSLLLCFVRLMSQSKLAIWELAFVSS